MYAGTAGGWETRKREDGHANSCPSGNQGRGEISVKLFGLQRLDVAVQIRDPLLNFPFMSVAH